MNYTAEQLLAMPDAERDAIAAEVCMGWELKEFAGVGRIYRIIYRGKDEPVYYRVLDKDWQPTQPTEKGKAQCWELGIRFNCFPEKHDNAELWDAVYGSGLDMECFASDNPQKAVVTAAILAAQAQQEK